MNLNFKSEGTITLFNNFMNDNLFRCVWTSKLISSQFLKLEVQTWAKISRYSSSIHLQNVKENFLFLPDKVPFHKSGYQLWDRQQKNNNV